MTQGLKSCWLCSPFSCQEEKITPSKRQWSSVGKIFHQTQLAEIWQRPLLVQSPVQEFSWACVEALWGSPSHPPPIAEGSLPLCSSSTWWHWLSSGFSSPLPELLWVTLFVLCLLPPRLVSSIWEHPADWVSPAHRQGIYGCFCMASWLYQLWFPTQHLLLIDRGWQEKPVSKSFPFSAVSQQKKH